MGLLKPKVQAVLSKPQLWQKQKAVRHLTKYEAMKRGICNFIIKMEDNLL